MIPLLTRIEQDLEKCSDPLRAAELQAERASYLARTGDFAAANQILMALRRNFGDGRDVRVSVWIMLVEGLIRYFRNLDSSARDRILRAYILSDASGAADLSRLAASWLAHIEFNRSDFQSMATYLLKCTLQPLNVTNSSSLRACLVTADACMYAGRTSEARVWYECTRQHAVAIGDEASLSAMIYNKAALGLSRARMIATSSKVDPALLRFVSMEVASAYNFHWGSGQAALAQLVEACRARTLLLEDRYAEALPLLERLCINDGMALNFKSDIGVLRLEYGYCLAKAGSIEAAREYFVTTPLSDQKGMTVDDQLIFLHSYIRLADLLDMATAESDLPEMLRQCRDSYEQELIAIQSALDVLFHSLSLK